MRRSELIACAVGLTFALASPGRAHGQQCEPLTFEDCRLRIVLRRGLERFAVRCTFRLGSGSNGIEPSSEGVTLSLVDGSGASSCVEDTVIPTRRGGRWIYRETESGPAGIQVLKLSQRDAATALYRVVALGRRADASCPGVRPWQLRLTLGGDCGTFVCPPEQTPRCRVVPSLYSATDDFERSTLGSDWNNFTGNAGIVNNSDLGILFGNMAGIEWNATTSGGYQFSEALLSLDKFANVLTQVFVRRRASDRARYAFHWNPEKTPAQWEIKFDGVPTESTRILASSTASGPDAGDTIRIEVSGTTLKGYHNGVEIITATDTAPNAIADGKPGVVARPRRDTTISYPAPVFESWAGGVFVR